MRKYNKSLIIRLYCGERGIRTPGGVTLNGFQDRRNRPLCHLSVYLKVQFCEKTWPFCGCKDTEFFRDTQTFGREISRGGRKRRGKLEKAVKAGGGAREPETTGTGDPEPQAPGTVKEGHPGPAARWGGRPARRRGEVAERPVECRPEGQGLGFVHGAEEVVDGLHGVEGADGHFNEDGVPVGHGAVPQAGELEGAEVAAAEAL